MARRLWAIALTLVLAGVSVASTFCEVTCKLHGTPAVTGHAHHHSHSTSAPGADVTMSPASHTCDHQLVGAIAIQQALQSLPLPAVVAVQVFAPHTSTHGALVPWPVDISGSPPGIIALTTQLRV